MKTVISILIPCFNADRWIAQAIESVLAQTWIDKEIMVVAHESTDRSLEAPMRDLHKIILIDHG
jgi:glycosyltransferase involved in cell wall biosynthesis